MTQADSSSGWLARVWPVSVIGLVCLAIFGVIVGAWYRGGWQDEYATFYFSDPAIPFRVAWLHVWPNEPNAPFFYVLARLWVHVAGPTMFARRLINLVPLGFLLAWFFVTARRCPVHRPFLTALALLAFSGQFFMDYFPEYRSYFWQYCAELVFLGAASVAYLDRDAKPDLFQLVALVFVILLHQVTALYAFVLLVVLMAVDVRRRFYLRAVCLAVVAVLALIPLGVYTWLQLHQFDLTDMDWIFSHGPLTSLQMLWFGLPLGFGNNRAALVAAAAVIFLPWYWPHGRAIGLILLIGLAASAATGFALIINLHHPLVVDRYFTFLTVEVIVMLALAIAPVLSAQPVLAMLVTASAMIFVVQSAIAVVHDRRWLRDADMVAQIVAQCPGTRVHAGSRPPAFGLDPIRHVGPAQGETIGMADIAAIDHLKLLPLAPDTPGACPVIYWTMYRAPSMLQIYEHYGDVASAANDSAGFGLSAATLAHTRAILPGGSGVILVVSAEGK